MTSAAHDSTVDAQGNVARDEETEAPTQRAPRRPRAATKGKQLNRMTKVMQRRLPIAVEEGKKRPHEPVQAAKFASEAGIIIRETMPILTRWKDYKDDQKYYNSFVSQLNGRLSVNTEDKATKEACTDMLRSAVKNQRYRLKQKYFNGVPANEISTTSHVSYMTDEQWRVLVAKWSDPKNMEISEKNKQNRSQVKFHQATGSRCYVAHLHAYKQKRNREEPSLDQTEELDAVDAFKTCHTSSKRGLSEPAREALSHMEALRAEPEGEMPASSVHLVSKVLSQSSSHQFLKSVGIKTSATSKASSSNHSELREQLAAEATAAVQGELDRLRKKCEEAEEQQARTQREL
ncbi:uncharacterized protein [Zea mays]|uniref:uncharacterized protein n=1 Tax=Zea mays TaxID=4577 RepID=UPI0009A988C0|nr:uncharacterized protein LOC103632679 [Zea mays]|eukprot:XP_020407724.1 uncharacterized protein LOC103632679 [Zea mays]